MKTKTLEQLEKQKLEIEKQIEALKRKTIKIKELNIEVEVEINQKGKSFDELVIPKGWRLLRIDEIVFLYNNYCKKLNMEYTWEFIEQPFNLNKKKYVAGFGASSDKANLDCSWDSADSDAGLGVRFCKDLEQK